MSIPHPSDQAIGRAETLQNAQAAAGDGTAIDMTGISALTVAVSGTYTGITANFEASLEANPAAGDWFAYALVNSAGARATTATATGLYNLPADAAVVKRFRARTTVATPTGAMTIKSLKARN